jgi:hypothetical protein
VSVRFFRWPGRNETLSEQYVLLVVSLTLSGYIFIFGTGTNIDLDFSSLQYTGHEGHKRSYILKYENWLSFINSNNAHFG